MSGHQERPSWAIRHEGSLSGGAAEPAHDKGTAGQQRRLLGLDVGSKTIGLAVSDPLGITAQGLPTIRRKNKRTDLEALEQVIRAHEVAAIVVGNPLRMSGAEGRQSEKVAAFAEDLRRRFGLPVHLWDERLTSVQANRLLREAELSIQKRAAAVDRIAAVLILQAYLDAHRL